MRWSTLMPCATAAIAAVVATVVGEPAAPSIPGAAQAAVTALADEVWEHRLRRELGLRARLGLPLGRLPDLSREEAQRDVTFARSILARLDAIPDAGLAVDDRLTVELLRWQMGAIVEAEPFFWLVPVVAPYTSPVNEVNGVLAELEFDDPGDLDTYLALVEAYPDFIDAVVMRLRGQLDRGIVLPAAQIDRVAEMFRATIRGPVDTPFAVAEERLVGLPGDVVDEFRARLREVVGYRVNPALWRLVSLLTGPYRAAAPDEAGLWQYPDGEEYYAYLVRQSTTLDLTPEQVHLLGLRSVRALEARMSDIREEIGFDGTADEFHAQIAADPAFFVATPEELETRFLAFIARIEPHVPALFNRTPAAPYGLERLDARAETVLTYGYYQSPSEKDPRGVYRYNGSRLDERSLFMTEGMLFHELVPGHHFQIALQAENDALHPVRRHAAFSAYTEGWAEYSSILAAEVLDSADPYDRYARAVRDSFFSTRLVVDTGMNHLRWPRQRAMQYMAAHTLESATQIDTETLRYAADMPGQALSYWIGATKFLELRDRAREALDERFDIRAFHDAVLSPGALPLAVLEAHVERFVAGRS